MGELDLILHFNAAVKMHMVLSLFLFLFISNSSSITLHSHQCTLSPCSLHSQLSRCDLKFILNLKLNHSLNLYLTLHIYQTHTLIHILILKFTLKHTHTLIHTHAVHTSFDPKGEKLLVVLVGLPNTGKTLIARKISRYSDSTLL